MVQKLSRPFEEYRNRYDHIAITREDGIVEMRLHSNGGPLVWSAQVHEELPHCYMDLNLDPENKVLIITGTGDKFSQDLDIDSYEGCFTPEIWPRLYHESKWMIQGLLDLEMPVIGAVNGPAWIHGDVAVLSDIVIASENASFADKGHFYQNVVPGDINQILWPALLGPNRGRYFLLTGQELNAQQALDLGVVSEVMPLEKLRDRAWELARVIAAKSPEVRRYTRALLVQEWKQKIQEQLSHGLAIQGSALLVQGAPTMPDD